MKTQTKNRAALGLTAASVVLLAACGGSDGGGSGGGGTPTDPPVAGSEIPTSATTSSAGAFAFVNGVASSKSETAEPLVAGDAVLAKSDTDEPSAF